MNKIEGWKKMKIYRNIEYILSFKYLKLNFQENSSWNVLEVIGFLYTNKQISKQFENENLKFKTYLF